jgi:hypothetical protein
VRIANCAGKSCGTDSCGGHCGTCTAGNYCNAAWACVPSCTNECSASGIKQCSGTGYQTCGNYDADSCLEWSAVTGCGSGQVCSGGACRQRIEITFTKDSVSGGTCYYHLTFKNNDATDIIIDSKRLFAYCVNSYVQDLYGANFVVGAGQSRTSGQNYASVWGYPSCVFDDIRYDQSGNELGRISFNCPNSW